MAESLLIRDYFNTTNLNELAEKISSLYSEFDQKGFLFDTITNLESQTYSERKNSLTQALIKYLPQDYPAAVDIILKTLPPPYKTDNLEATAKRFYITSLSAYISTCGLDHFDLSMDALCTITKCFTSEFDVRHFILKYPNKTLELFKKWAKSPNPHVRRLTSEGSRPNLPWGKKLQLVIDDPKNTTLPILTILQGDSSEYVRRSVANHLNDITKTSPDLVVHYMQKWIKQNPSKDKDRMINHALRSLIKGGHKGALSVIGYDDDFDLSLQFKKNAKTVNWGSTFDFEFTITNNRRSAKKLIIDYIIGFQKKDGKINDKVFKLKKVELSSKESITISKKQSFKPISTRVYYPGLHTLAIQINGVILKKVEFELLEKL